MTLRCKLLAALLAGAAAGAFCEANRASDEARESQAVDVPDYEPGASAFGPSLADATAEALLAEAAGQASVYGASVVAAAEELCRREAQPTQEFDVLGGVERFRGPEDVL